MSIDHKNQKDTGVQLHCPFESRLNPHVELVQERSLQWCSEMGVVIEGPALTHLRKSNIGWLVGRAFPNASVVGLQVASDWTHLFCLLDDWTDALNPPDRLTPFLKTLSKAFQNGVSFSNDPFVIALLDLRSRMLELSSLGWLDGFARHLKDIFLGYSWEAANRVTDIVPSLGTYVYMRERTAGLYPQFHLAALTDGINLPADVYDDPIVHGMMAAASNCIGWANDLCTYPKEIEDGEHNNLVIVLMAEESLSVDEAAARAVQMHDAEIQRFLEFEARLRSALGHVQDLTLFVEILRCAIRGHLDWAQATRRYLPSNDETAEQSASESSTWARVADFSY